MSYAETLERVAAQHDDLCQGCANDDAVTNLLDAWNENDRANVPEGMARDEDQYIAACEQVDREHLGLMLLETGSKSCNCREAWV